MVQEMSVKLYRVPFVLIEVPGRFFPMAYFYPELTGMKMDAFGKVGLSA